MSVGGTGEDAALRTTPTRARCREQRMCADASSIARSGRRSSGDRRSVTAEQSDLRDRDVHLRWPKAQTLELRATHTSARNARPTPTPR